jgi:phenylpyruvate tautomerase PptA (4-oxalocrotonate tautomerase family)
MPMLDAYIPIDALTPTAEEQLLADLTDLLITNEGADPSNPQVRSIAWLFVHRPEIVYVAGAPATAPHYRFIASVPEGQYDPERRQAMVHDITEAVLDADPGRVWVFTPEVPDGTWGGFGQIATLADIATLASGDPERGRRYAEERLGAQRSAAALA